MMPSTLVLTMEISALLMARLQFVLSLNFLVLFSALATALGWMLAVMRWQSIRQPESGWLGAYRFWVRVFALATILSLGCAVPVLLELGILWPSLIERIGNVAGPLLALAIVTFFVIKAVFVGVMLFGQKRVSSTGHLFSIIMVALGFTATVFWGVVLQSWTHTPDGATLIDGRYQVLDWAQLVFNAALSWHLLLFVAGAFLTLAFLMIGILAWQGCRRPLEESERLAFQAGFWLAVAAMLVQIWATDGTARLVARYQPATAAAVLGFWEANGQTESMHARWLGRASDGSLIGIEAAASHAPPVRSLYWLARIGLMLAAGMTILLCVLGWCRWRKGRNPSLYSSGVLHVSAWLSWTGAALWLVSWNLVDMGRSPYLVWGTLTQADLLTETDAGLLAAGLLVSFVCYLLLLTGLIKMLRHAARFGVVPVRKPGASA